MHTKIKAYFYPSDDCSIINLEITVLSTKFSTPKLFGMSGLYLDEASETYSTLAFEFCNLEEQGVEAALTKLTEIKTDLQFAIDKLDVCRAICRKLNADSKGIEISAASEGESNDVAK